MKPLAALALLMLSGCVAAGAVPATIWYAVSGASMAVEVVADCSPVRYLLGRCAYVADDEEATKYDGFEGIDE